MVPWMLNALYGNRCRKEPLFLSVVSFILFYGSWTNWCTRITSWCSRLSATVCAITSMHLKSSISTEPWLWLICILSLIFNVLLPLLRTGIGTTVVCFKTWRSSHQWTLGIISRRTAMPTFDTLPRKKPQVNWQASIGAPISPVQKMDGVTPHSFEELFWEIRIAPECAAQKNDERTKDKQRLSKAGVLRHQTQSRNNTQHLTSADILTTAAYEERRGKTRGRGVVGGEVGEVSLNQQNGRT